MANQSVAAFFFQAMVVEHQPLFQMLSHQLFLHVTTFSWDWPFNAK